MDFLTLLFKNAEIAIILTVVFWIIMFIVVVKLISAIFQIKSNTAETRYQLMLLNEKYSRVHGLDDDQIIEDIKEGRKYEKSYDDFYNDL